MSLKQLNLEGKDRVEVAIERLQQNEPPEGYQLAFSGGKDSVAIHKLAVLSEVLFFPFYNWTGIDPPELLRFVRYFFPDVEIRRPEKSMWRLIEEHGILPMRRIRFCCEHLKERGNKPGWLITGVRWSESPMRRRYKVVDVSARGKSITHLHPIVDWADEDVWEFIREYQVPYCSLYDEGFKRLGCILCPFVHGQELEMEIERFPKHVEMWRRACNRLVETHNKNRTWKDGEELFQWWLTRERRPKEIVDCQARFI